jgi:hypothetical protein
MAYDAMGCLGRLNPMPELPLQGVYGILDTGGTEEPCNAGWMYIGSSVDCHRRHRQHDYLLRRGRHHCLALQDGCSGIDGVRWRFVLLEEIERRLDLLDCEWAWRKRTVRCFNPVDGSFFLP